MASIAFYGDSDGSEVFAMDVDAMSLLCRIPTGSGPYPVDAVGKTHVLASTRKEASVTPIDVTSLTPLSKVALPHKPRSSTTNSNGLILISGADSPLATIVDSRTWLVVSTFGEPINGKIEDFGGQLASGHERWLHDNDRFFLIDRIRRRISLYRLSTASLLWSVNTPTSCHHVVPDPQAQGVYFAMCEGNQTARIPPSVMKLVPAGDAFTIEAHTFLPVDVGFLAACGGHHVDVSGNFLYCGSNEGFCYVLNKSDLSYVTRVATGAGNGHTGFIDDAGVAITINHTAQFVTLIDLATHTLKTNVQVSKAASTPAKRTQGHTSGKRGKFFYMMASLDSTFHEIDAGTGVVTRSCYIPASSSTALPPFPMQGVFMWDAPGAQCTQCC